MPSLMAASFFARFGSARAVELSMSRAICRVALSLEWVAESAMVCYLL